MKLLAVILVLMIAAQPVQAGICDMTQSDGQTDMHAGMQHDGGDAASGHDCCEPDGSDQGSGCDNRVQCGSCAAGLAGISSLQGPVATPVATHLVLLGDGRISPSHAAPPFRPPTHIS
jgi:hypothetical protein